MAEELKGELEKLRMKLKVMEAKQAAEAAKPHHPIYIKSERKIPKLAGRPTKDSDPKVDDWISDMKEHLPSIPTNEGKIEFVIDHLTGSAKTEVRLRPADNKKTADDILKIIEDTYKLQDTAAQMRHKFYERVQGEHESLEEYSLALMKLLHNIGKKEGGEITNKDKILTEKFIDGVRDQQLKRELRRFSMENAALPFIEFRGRMLLWVDDTQTTSDKTVGVNKVSTEKKSTNDEILDMMKKQQDILEKQQQQIELLTQMTQHPNYQQQNRGRGFYGRGNRGRGRGYGRGAGRGSQSDYKIICYYCKAEGHKRNECPKLLGKQNSKDNHQQHQGNPNA